MSTFPQALAMKPSIKIPACPRVAESAREDHRDREHAERRETAEREFQGILLRTVGTQQQQQGHKAAEPRTRTENVQGVAGNDDRALTGRRGGGMADPGLAYQEEGSQRGRKCAGNITCRELATGSQDCEQHRDEKQKPQRPYLSEIRVKEERPKRIGIEKTSGIGGYAGKRCGGPTNPGDERNQRSGSYGAANVREPRQSMCLCRQRVKRKQ